MITFSIRSLSKITDHISTSMNFQLQKGLKGTPIYMAPEILASEKYSTSSDVYAFAFIVYEIMMLEEPFKDFNKFKLVNKVHIEGFHPEISSDVPDAYRKLIEACWSQKEEERPSFDKIVEELKTNGEFVTEVVDQSEFLDYVDIVD